MEVEKVEGVGEVEKVEVVGEVGRNEGSEGSEGNLGDRGREIGRDERRSAGIEGMEQDKGRPDEGREGPGNTENAVEDEAELREAATAAS